MMVILYGWRQLSFLEKTAVCYFIWEQERGGGGKFPHDRSILFKGISCVVILVCDKGVTSVSMAAAALWEIFINLSASYDFSRV